jgi:hypothetical protein
MAQAVSRRPLTAEARFRARSVHVVFVVDKSGTGTGFSPSSSVFNKFHKGSIIIYNLGNEQQARWWPQFRDAASLHRQEHEQVQIFSPICLRSSWTQSTFFPKQHIRLALQNKTSSTLSNVRKPSYNLCHTIQKHVLYSHVSLSISFSSPTHVKIHTFLPS